MDALAEKVAQRHIARVVPVRLDSGKRQRINRDLRRAGFDGNERFKTIGTAVNAAFSVLAKHGLEPDDTLRADLFYDKKGHRGIDVAFTNPQDSFSPVPVKNSMLAFSWELLGERFEVIAYMS